MSDQEPPPAESAPPPPEPVADPGPIEVDNVMKDFDFMLPPKHLDDDTDDDPDS